MTRVCACEPSPNGPLFTKHAADCPRRPFAALDHFAKTGPTRWAEWPALVASGVVVVTGREYLRCESCAKKMPIDVVPAGFRCHLCGGEYIIETEEQEMASETTIEAPRNPYRKVERRSDGELWSTGTMGPAPRRYDTEHGPGLTAADIDHLVRRHYLDGHAAAERAGEKRIEELERQLVQAFDEGYTAGRVERAQGLARDVFMRLTGARSAIIETRGGPKSKAYAALDDIEREVEAVQDFAAGLFSPHAAELAASRAAAQVARDET